MESARSYQLQQLQQQKLGRYSSSESQSTHDGAAAIHEWYPSLHQNTDDYNRYMNEILPNSIELLRRNAHFQDMGYDEYKIFANQSTDTIQNAVDLNENLWLSTSFSSNDQICRQQLSARELYSSAESWVRFSCPDSSSCNNYVFNHSTNSPNLGLATSSLDSTHQGLNFTIDFMSHMNNGESFGHSSKENTSLCCDHIHQDLSYSPSSSSNKTSTFRNEAVPGTKRVSTSSQRRSSHEAAAKKARGVSQSSCSLPKVKKENIGDRVAALHRLVAPFGKSDTASVLTEAIGYIQFLQDQIQTLSMPCMKPSLGDTYGCFQGELSKKDIEKELEAKKQDLSSRGLCLLPLSIASYISSSCIGFGGI